MMRLESAYMVQCGCGAILTTPTKTATCTCGRTITIIWPAEYQPKPDPPTISEREDLA